MQPITKNDYIHVLYPGRPNTHSTAKVLNLTPEGLLEVEDVEKHKGLVYQVHPNNATRLNVRTYQPRQRFIHIPSNVEVIIATELPGDKIEVEQIPFGNKFFARTAELRSIESGEVKGI